MEAKYSETISRSLKHLNFRKRAGIFPARSIVLSCLRSRIVPTEQELNFCIGSFLISGPQIGSDGYPVNPF